jgi:hypothetical protein
MGDLGNRDNVNLYDGSDNYKAVYAYGNYIDEVLVKGSAEGIYNYIHDHLQPCFIDQYEWRRC